MLSRRLSVAARRRGDQAAAGGFALIELVVAMALMAVAFAGISTSLASTMSMRKSNQETARAVRAALSFSETLREEEFGTLFARYNLDGNDDPDGIGTAPGPNFAVPGLRPRPDDPDGMVGWIVFPGDGAALREDVDSRGLGLPRDLNGDGVVDATDCATTYEILPVTIILQWDGPGGDNSIRLDATLTNR